ncbi:MAG: hypothetical protein IJ606_01725 [Bacteroidaceae bacterium]|nr:hypothetical protein [Bacteroidaceae bacterium]
MKAYRIKSTEYEGNFPHIFIYVNGEYYGDMNYPRNRNFPEDVEYWKTATCADANRYFKVDEVEISAAQVDELKALHRSLADNLKKVQAYTDDLEENRRREKYNHPYYVKERELKDNIEAIIKAL